MSCKTTHGIVLYWPGGVVDIAARLGEEERLIVQTHHTFPERFNKPPRNGIGSRKWGENIRQEIQQTKQQLSTPSKSHHSPIRARDIPLNVDT